MSEDKKPSENVMHKSLSRDTNAALKDIMDSINTLGKLYAEETDALKKSDTEKFLALQDKKIALAQDYQSFMGQMMARKNELKSADPAMKERLQKLHQNFSDLSKENLDAIERMQRCTERLGNTIRNAAIKTAHNERGYSYGESGSIPNTSRRKAVSSGLSETV